MTTRSSFVAFMCNCCLLIFLFFWPAKKLIKIFTALIWINFTFGQNIATYCEILAWAKLKFFRRVWFIFQDPCYRHFDEEVQKKKKTKKNSRNLQKARGIQAVHTVYVQVWSFILRSVARRKPTENYFKKTKSDLI